MMSLSTSVIFYDGVVSKPRQAQISPFDHNSVQVRYEEDGESIRQYQYQDMILIGALGELKPVIELPDDARIEFSDELPDWFELGNKKLHHSIWKLERSPTLILCSVLFMVAFAFGVVKWGIPQAAHIVAYQLPEQSLTQLGNEAERYVLDWTTPSQLPKSRQQQIQKEYLAYVAEGQPAQLVFRGGGQIGANALALPNHTIILTDELVQLAKNDQEIIGVLAHEQGHLIKRHSLQQALSSLGLSVLYVAITGDSSDLFTTMPLALAGANYSRNFEAEADQYALQTMHRHQIQVIHFANFLQRLGDEDESQDQNSPFKFLSTHPATPERIKAVKAFEMKHQSQS